MLGMRNKMKPPILSSSLTWHNRELRKLLTAGNLNYEFFYF